MIRSDSIPFADSTSTGVVTPRPLWLSRAGPALAALAATVALALAATTRAFDPATAPPPWSSRCPLTIRAHEDGSASFYCGRHAAPVGTLDAETGRVRLFIPR